MKFLDDNFNKTISPNNESVVVKIRQDSRIIFDALLQFYKEVLRQTLKYSNVCKPLHTIALNILFKCILRLYVVVKNRKMLQIAPINFQINKH